MNIKYTKGPKILKMTIKYTNIFVPMSVKIYPNWYEKYHLATLDTSRN
jgi:hypothetical protein